MNSYTSQIFFLICIGFCFVVVVESRSLLLCKPSNILLKDCFVMKSIFQYAIEPGIWNQRGRTTWKKIIKWISLYFKMYQFFFFCEKMLLCLWSMDIKITECMQLSLLQKSHCLKIQKVLSKNWLRHMYPPLIQTSQHSRCNVTANIQFRMW